MTMNIQQTPYGHQPPPVGGNRGVIIALVLVLVLVIGGGLALVLTQKGKTVTVDAQGQVQPQGQQPVQPQGQQQPPAQQGQPQGQQQGQQPQNQGGKAPAFPTSIGNLTSQDESGFENTRSVFYGPSQGELSFLVTHLTGLTKDQAKIGGSYTAVGQWECATMAHNGTACLTEAYSGVVMITSAAGNNNQDEVLRFGDEFIAAWK
ncbi:MAG: hypothetical protein Q4D89_06615 [Arachnia propionica]|uniref:hypothetical protein n=1 Tax=Arachnia propionica TaxID=1750 RepID=UPI00270480D5|nr:hypothetical protein [Arachnia propionica]